MYPIILAAPSKPQARQYESSALAVLHLLGIQPSEMENWNCCGVVHSLASDNLMRHVAPVRIFNQLQQQGSSEVVTFCDMCYNTLAQANLLVQQEPAKRETINEFIATEDSYQGQITVLHLLQVLRDRIGFQAIKKKVKRPLKGLKVFP
ncbi:MAG: heterodisulfide reductase, subunit B, partial [Chloroflexaceae bacterium]|nr:heterodisulfide reductase, subunit B [Chloroflexaceae bacterium]